ncbi:hypothetical protein G6F43_005168 [Rhizopus delemar]|nr:hypothetical protein G6F43_005168 [Rhizopus delemar]
MQPEQGRYGHIIQDTSPIFSSWDNEKLKKSKLIHQIHRHMFNTTGTSYPSVESLLIGESLSKKKEKQLRDYIYHVNPYKGSDLLMYRQQRSEQLLMRMIFHKKLDLSQLSIMRFSKGVFAHEVWNAQASIDLLCIDNVASQSTFHLNEALTGSFYFNNLHQTHHSSHETFVPYSYTFGVRYTSPYNDRHDLIVRGRLSTWLLTFVLFNALDRPIVEPHVPLAGLFPFAVVFKPLATQVTTVPHLTLLYEQYTMEYDNPYSLPDNPTPSKQPIPNILICDIPDDIAASLKKAEEAWATHQGLVF